MSKIENKIKELNIKLPDPKPPVGAYVATKIVGNLLFISGQISADENLNLIKGVKNDSIISEKFSGNELKLPLMVNSNETKYILEQNEVKDTLIILHQTKHLYLNRSCGFKSNFLIKSETEIIKESGWIREISIVQDSIFNEEKTNIFIHF